MKSKDVQLTKLKRLPQTLIDGYNLNYFLPYYLKHLGVLGFCGISENRISS